MKKKKWLIIVVFILFLINLAFYGLMRWGKVDQLVKERVENYLEKQLQADILIDDFSFNDKQLNINGFQVIGRNNDYTLDVRQIYVKYDLPRLIFSNFTNYKAIEEIKVFEPVLQIDLKPPEIGSASTPAIPNIAKYFKHLSLYNGSIQVAYKDDDLEVLARIDTLDLKLKNTNKTEIEYIFRNKDGSGSNGNLTLNKGEFTLLDLQFRDISPQELYIRGIDDLNFSIDLDLNRTSDMLVVSGVVKDLTLQAQGRLLETSSLPFTVNNNDLELQLEEAYLDGSRITGKANISDFLEPEKEISAFLKASDIALQNYFAAVKGMAEVEMQISGTILNPVVEITANSAQLKFYQQQLEEISLSGSYQNDTLNFDLQQLKYDGNLITGSGSYTPAKGLSCELTGSNFSWQSEELFLSGDLNAQVDFQKDLQVLLQVRRLSAAYNNYKLNDMNLQGTLNNSILQLEVNRTKADLSINFTGDLREKTLAAELEFFRFDPALVFQNTALPLISGSLNLQADTTRVRTSSSVRVFDRNIASLNGIIIFDSFLDLQREKVSLTLRTSQARYNFEPFSLNLLAEGDLDSLYFKKFDINKEIFIKGHVALGEKRNIDLDLSFESLDLKKYLKYFTNYNFYSLMEGKVSLDLNYRSAEQDSVSGMINIEKFSYNNSSELKIDTEILGNSVDLNAISTLFLNEQKLFNVNSKITLQPQLTYNFQSSIRNLDLARIFSEDQAKGFVNAEVKLCHECGERVLDLQADVYDLTLPWITADSLHIDLSQEANLLKIKDFTASSKGNYLLSARGSLGYDLLFMNIYPDTNRVRLNFEGDIFKMLAADSKFITEAGSNCNIDLQIGLEEKGLSIKQGVVSLRKGTARISNQLAKLEKVKVDMEIKDNELEIINFTGKMGPGNFFLENQINYDEDEFVLGNLQIGKLYLYTDAEGINIHLPNYMPGNSVGNSVIKGRNSDKLEISGPFDEIHLIGDVYFYNGAAIFPANTENLVKFFAKITEEKVRINYDIPLNLDLILHFEDNIRYVTYPLNLLVDPGSYMNLKFDGERFSVTDAFFTSESGFIDIFGTQMTADYVQVKISPYEKKLNVNGLFYQQASDGTLLTLLVTSRNDPASAQFFALDFDLRSDDPNDSQTDILALLRYGRRQDELSPDQRSTILQDEVIQLAGLGIESAVIDPFISPVETWIRQLLNLDFFHLQTDLIQNIFSRYSSDRTDYVVDEEGRKLSQTTTDLFLNNLSIGMGKYLSRRVFLDYELQFQKPQDISIASDMGIYHNISIRYDLPFKLKLAYKFHILPFDEKNTHEISLERSFRF